MTSHLPDHLVLLRNPTSPLESSLLLLSLHVHKDKNNHNFAWLIAFGDFTGGRLWIESPLGTHPPPNPRNAVERKRRGDYFNTHNTWICFDPQLYHALEEVTSGNRVSIALFTPKSWNKLTHNCIEELIDIGLYPAHSALSTDAGPTPADAAAPFTLHCATPTSIRSLLQIELAPWLPSSRRPKKSS